MGCSPHYGKPGLMRKETSQILGTSDGYACLKIRRSKRSWNIMILSIFFFRYMYSGFRQHQWNLLGNQ